MFESYFFYWGTVWQALPKIASGLLITVEVAVLSIGFGLGIGLVAALARNSSNRLLSIAALVYVEAMRNSPSLVKMYFIYFGLPSFGIYPSPLLSAVSALVLHNGAYMTEIVRGGLAAIPRAQVQAARSLGMGPWLTFQVVIFPQTFNNALPALGNNWVEIVKDTSLTSALSVREVFHVIETQISETLRSFEFLLIAAVVYLLLTAGVAGGLRGAEARIKYRR
jgi:polar amino acid transport system permease protein